MEKSSQNENKMNNNDKIYLNDVVMEEESKLTKSTNKQKVIMQMRGAKK
jgi:hypothetical protein